MSEVSLPEVDEGAPPYSAEVDLRLVVDSVPGLVSYVDTNYRFVFTNRRYREWFGCGHNEFVGMSVSEVLGADIFLHVKPHLDRAFRGETTSFDRFHRYHGILRYVRTTIVPDIAPLGHVRGVVILVEDISSRKRAEDAEQELERQLTLLIEASSSLLASPETQDVLRNILDVARRFVEADAYSVWRRDGQIWKIVVSEGLSPQYSSSVSAVGYTLESGRPIVVEDVEKHAFVSLRLEAHRAEGIRSLITVPLQIQNAISGALVFYYREPHNFTDLEVLVSSAIGNLAGAAIGSADLYQREKQLRELAQANEQRSAFLAEAGQILSSSLEFDQTLASIVELSVPRFADLAAVELLAADSKLRRVALKHVNPDKLEFVNEFHRRFPPLEDDIASTALRTGKSVLIEDIPDSVLVERARTAEHLAALRQFDIKSLILAPLIVNNRIFGLLSFVSAESGRHYNRFDLAFAEELARRAATAMDNARLFTDSTEAQDALRQANAELSRANEDLNQFAYSASHDLQEPLRMLMIYSQLLDRKYRGALDGQAGDYLSFIVDGAKRMEMLISDLLAYMQVVNTAQVPQSPIDANLALQRVLETLSIAISESQASVECDCLPRLAVQDFHLVQLFQNLVSNAIKYRSAAPPKIRVTCNREGGCWKICVEDNGIGIPEQYRDQVFKLFKRLHDKEKYPGTGIGLAICQKIVERYGGRIWIESNPAGGCSICITLPAIDTWP
ncbi:MAG TPA: GAF domain-containing protein [Bryobacteraceae bacterium]|jgi:PAS domain S-box-containing protein|nr:GAF domain-containing protein [Bryobacteraceae bacterium]